MTMLRQIPASAQVLLGSDALAHLVTIGVDGTPQVSVVWCGIHDDDVLFCTEASSAKIRNIKRDSRVVLSIEDEVRNVSGKQHHLVLHGHAEVLGPADPALCDELCRAYLGRANHVSNLRNSATAVTVRVRVDRIGGNGPWVAQD